MNEEQKVQELLKPRYKVIADYFYNPYKIGDIIKVEYPDRSVHLTTTSYRDEFGETKNQENFLHPNQLGNFPHLFRKLEWHENRDASEMPEYVKYAENGMVAKVDHFDLETTSAWFMYLEGGVHPYCPGGSALENTHWLPATAADYQAFITKPVNQE